MKNIKNLLIIAGVFSMVLSACKYDEGPGISFVTKRDRVANEWSVTGYKVDGTDDATLKNSFSHGDSIELVLNIARDGGYGFNLQYTKSYQATTKWRKLLQANYPIFVAEYIWSFNKNSLFELIGSNGKWTFANKHDEVHFGQYDLSHNYTEFKPLVCKIIMLKNKMLKLEYVAPDNKKHLITFEPINTEAKLLK